MSNGSTAFIGASITKIAAAVLMGLACVSNPAKARSAVVLTPSEFPDFKGTGLGVTFNVENNYGSPDDFSFAVSEPSDTNRPRLREHISAVENKIQNHRRFLRDAEKNPEDHEVLKRMWLPFIEQENALSIIKGALSGSKSSAISGARTPEEYVALASSRLLDSTSEKIPQILKSYKADIIKIESALDTQIAANEARLANRAKKRTEAKTAPIAPMSDSTATIHETPLYTVETFFKSIALDQLKFSRDQYESIDNIKKNIPIQIKASAQVLVDLPNVRRPVEMCLASLSLRAVSRPEYIEMKKTLEAAKAKIMQYEAFWEFANPIYKQLIQTFTSAPDTLIRRDAKQLFLLNKEDEAVLREMTALIGKSHAIITQLKAYPLEHHTKKSKKKASPTTTPTPDAKDSDSYNSLLKRPVILDAAYVFGVVVGVVAGLIAGVRWLKKSPEVQAPKETPVRAKVVARPQTRAASRPAPAAQEAPAALPALTAHKPLNEKEKARQRAEADQGAAKIKKEEAANLERQEKQKLIKKLELFTNKAEALKAKINEQKKHLFFIEKKAKLERIEAETRAMIPLGKKEPPTFLTAQEQDNWIDHATQTLEAWEKQITARLLEDAAAMPMPPPKAQKKRTAKVATEASPANGGAGRDVDAPAITPTRDILSQASEEDGYAYVLLVGFYRKNIARTEYDTQPLAFVRNEQHFKSIAEYYHQRMVSFGEHRSKCPASFGRTPRGHRLAYRSLLIPEKIAKMEVLKSWDALADAPLNGSALLDNALLMPTFEQANIIIARRIYWLTYFYQHPKIQHQHEAIQGILADIGSLFHAGESGARYTSLDCSEDFSTVPRDIIKNLQDCRGDVFHAFQNSTAAAASAKTDHGPEFFLGVAEQLLGVQKPGGKVNLHSSPFTDCFKKLGIVEVSALTRLISPQQSSCAILEL